MAEPNIQQLIDAAVLARAHAYAPYSTFKVGAALLLGDGSVVSGVNVENASYGLTMCAERNAVANAVLQGAQPGDVVAVAIATDANAPTSPCGACRQVLAEFARPDSLVVSHNVRDRNHRSFTVAELLPAGFDAANFKK